MELTLLESTPTRIKFEIKDEGHTFCNILRKTLWQEKSTEIAGYAIEHSLVSEPVFVVETSKGDPKKQLATAVASLKKTNKELLAQFKKL